MSENSISAFLNDLLQDRDLHGNSVNFANWMSQLTLYTCKYCTQHHDTIIDISYLGNREEVAAHPRCKCVYVPMRTKTAGTATNQKFDGADYFLFYFQQLPDYYISKKQAKQLGWQSWKGNLGDVLPNTMIGGDMYENKDHKLPQSPARIWYEADINYSGGYRNRQRILYSNDGLLFVTYDHYQTFYEIT